MSLSATLRRSWEGDGVTIEDSEVPSAGQEVRISETIPGASTDLLVALTLDVSQIRAMILKCDRDVTLETNSGSSPGNTVALKAGKAVIWSTDCGLANPLTVDITALYVTLGAGADATLQARFLVDPTV